MATARPTHAALIVAARSCDIIVGPMGNELYLGRYGPSNQVCVDLSDHRRYAQPHGALFSL
jgi:hypothetical protein